MLIKNTLAFLAVAIAALPEASALYHWDTKYQVYQIGAQIGARTDKWATWMGRCGGSDIPEGGYGCATWYEYAPRIRKPTGAGAVYKCTNGWMKLYDRCKADRYTTTGAIYSPADHVCVRNSPGKGQKFYPHAVKGSKVVCAPRMAVMAVV